MHRDTLRTIAVLLALLPASASAQRTAAVPTWHLVEEWRVGGDADGGHSFDNAISLGRLPNGTLVHFDYKATRLFFLDTKGAVIASAGRQGAGPGDLSGASGLVISPNGTVLVNDRGNTRISTFDAHGKFLGITRMPGTRWSGGSPWTAALLDDGRLIERLDVVGRPDVVSETVVWAKGLQRSDTVRTTACAAVTSDDFNRACIPLKTATGELIMNVPLPFANPAVDQAFDHSGMVWESYPGRSNRIVAITR